MGKLSWCWSLICGGVVRPRIYWSGCFLVPRRRFLAIWSLFDFLSGKYIPFRLGYQCYDGNIFLSVL